jgi:hypothetical protein
MEYPQSHSDCSEDQVFDVGMWMCMPVSQQSRTIKMLMLSGNIFGGYISQEKPRGRDAAYSTSMVMWAVGSSFGERHYFNLDVMTTAELWTVSKRGYPLILQIGEHDNLGNSYIDAQHPHSSPLMGLTLSDTIRLNGDLNTVKLFFAPRGEVTDGPVAFMHRPTGMINSDAPLGHHVGQDVGHISSTVLGASFKLRSIRFETSVFHGQEPEPTKVDLPLGVPNSIALRFIKDFYPDILAMISGTYLHQPEHDEPSVDHQWRFSTSLYHRFDISEDWEVQNTIIYGGITSYDGAPFLNSVAEEFLLSSGNANVWGRVELLQRTPNELNLTSYPESNDGKWVSAVTLGYTHFVSSFEGVELGVGASVTKSFLPDEFQASYGGNPWSGKFFLQLKGMRMWHQN